MDTVWTGDVAGLWSPWLASVHKTLGSIAITPHERGMVAPTCYPSTWEIEAGRLLTTS